MMTIIIIGCLLFASFVWGFNLGVIWERKKSKNEDVIQHKYNNLYVMRIEEHELN